MSRSIVDETTDDELRPVAKSLEIANRHLAEMLARKCREVDALRGSAGALQQSLALVEKYTRREQHERAVAAAPPPAKPERAPRSTTGPTPQPNLPVVEREFPLDDADRACPSCGGALVEMAGQFETSEMIDVVDVAYRVVKVKQKKLDHRACEEAVVADPDVGVARPLASLERPELDRVEHVRAYHAAATLDAGRLPQSGRQLNTGRGEDLRCNHAATGGGRGR